MIIVPNGFFPRDVPERPRVLVPERFVAEMYDPPTDDTDRRPFFCIICRDDHIRHVDLRLDGAELALSDEQFTAMIINPCVEALERHSVG
jgi:hypothetical protein